MPPPYARAVAGGLELRLLVVPGASRDELVGAHGDRLKLRVAAPPEDGRANAAAVALIRAWLGARVELVAGHASREKTVLVAGLTALPESASAKLKR